MNRPRPARSLTTAALALAGLLTATACGTRAGAEQPRPSAPPPPAAAPAAPVAPAPVAPARVAPATHTASGEPVTAPTISTEAGDPRGVVVLWPRVIPAATADGLDPIAIAAQARMSGLVAQTLPGRPITLRPKPQRVCPQGGCNGLSVGLLLAHVETGCAAAALIGGPGRTPRRIIPWAGRMQLKAMQSEFRGTPESNVTLQELVPCDTLVRTMGERDAAVAEALKFADKLHGTPKPPGK